MIPTTPALLIAAAQTYVGIVHDGLLAQQLLAQVWAGPRAEHVLHWDVAFVHHVGYWSHANPAGAASSWPLAPSATCDELFALAERQRAVREDPRAGDIFLLKSSLDERFHRTGIVVQVDSQRHTDREGKMYQECITIEGDSDPTMARFGGQVLRHQRRLSGARGDRFIRWTALDARIVHSSEARHLEDSVLQDAA